MPIVRSYACSECFHQMTVTLSADEWEKEAPICPRCNAYDLDSKMQQQFKPPAIGGSVRARAAKMAEDIAANDYHVGNMETDVRHGDTRKIRYKDEGSPPSPSTWGMASETIQSALAAGRQVRMQHGSGLDVLQENLKSGAQKDLIEISKRRSTRVW